jgi:DNA-binding LytR/AlgR family response regulator
MNCIIVDDEPLAREGIRLLVSNNQQLTLMGAFSSALAAGDFLTGNKVDLIFLDIQMPGINGITFAKTVPSNTLVIFTTAFSEYALDSYEVDAIDYLVKPVVGERFQKAVQKALSYHSLLEMTDNSNEIETFSDDFIFVKADRRIFKVHFEDIGFIEGLKDYVVIHTPAQKIITAMNIKTIYDQLPKKHFIRVSKSYIVNFRHIASFDNNTIFIQGQEIPIGNSYRAYFFDEFVSKKLIRR